ncbi:MAG: hypothetical protein J0M18_12345 [Ignavibacteria bacterium]|nr:hypothetical protein [Ignavibacteria bacterium]
MFESLVKEKTNSEKSKIRLLSPVSRNTVAKSELSPFIKNFIFNETQEITESDYLDELIEKGVKLQFNFTLRPKWTLLNYVYGSIESKSDNEIRHKLKVFTFYKFYPDTILNYLDEETHLYVSRSKVELLLKDTNEVLYSKLTNEISGVKIKNFLVNIFKLKYEDESKINLESSIPFSFIKIFLEDKEYDDLLKKFDVIPNLKDSTLVSYKDIIKVLTDKYTVHETKHEERPEKKEEKKEDSKEEIFEPITITQDNIKEELLNKEKKIEIEVPKKEFKKEVKTPKKEINYTKYDIYSDDLVKERDAKEKEEQDNISEQDKEVFAETHDNDIGDQYEIKRLFSEKELNVIRDKIYGGSKTAMKNSFRTLAGLTNWKDAASHLKDLYNENKVHIYHKPVVKFTDALQEHFTNKANNQG